VLRGPSVARPAAEVVGPDQLVQEGGATEDVVQQHLDVVRFAVVDVQVQRAARSEQSAGLAQQRLQHAEVVLVHVEVGVPRRLDRRVAAALESGAVAVLVPDGGDRATPLGLSGVERRVDVDQLETGVGQRWQQGRAVAEQHVVGSRVQVEHVGPGGFEPPLDGT
jgi:hypothetical protein